VRETERKPSVPRTPIERGKPLVGEWLWTTRPFAEKDLAEELTLALGPNRVSVLGPAVVRSVGAPTFKEGGLDLTFARQGFKIEGEARGEQAALTSGCVNAIRKMAPDASAWALSAWVPDTDALNPLAPMALALETDVIAALDKELPNRVEPSSLPNAGAIYKQIALLGPEHAIAGSVPSDAALSLAPGGRTRMRVGGERPSRAARKVEEALSWLGVAPGAGEVCVDLGAAPGGWSWALLDRRAKVIAVDPAELRADIAQHRSLVHHKASAFQYAPTEPVDWLFCDMAWKPLEVAQLLAKWGRRRWARMLVANLKLPMKQKATTVMDLRTVIAGGGWRRIRTRQLYHDRDEITLTAYL
jgi:23S rRNA (cytidine2498-2'-O)-methyltransferase